MNISSDFPTGGLKLESLSNVPRTYMRCIEALRFDPCEVSLVGGLKWTRTTDLALIRRAL